MLLCTQWNEFVAIKLLHFFLERLIFFSNPMRFVALHWLICCTRRVIGAYDENPLIGRPSRSRSHKFFHTSKFEHVLIRRNGMHILVEKKGSKHEGLGMNLGLPSGYWRFSKPCMDYMQR